jgi:hypothetical protein
MLYTTTNVIETATADQNWIETHRRRAAVATALVAALDAELETDFTACHDGDNPEQQWSFSARRFRRSDRFSDYAAKTAGNALAGSELTFKVSIGGGTCRVTLMPVAAERGDWVRSVRNKLRAVVAGQGTMGNRITEVKLNEGKRGFVVSKLVDAVKAACVASTEARAEAFAQNERRQQRDDAVEAVRSHAKALGIPCRVTKAYRGDNRTDVVDVEFEFSVETAKRLLDLVAKAIEDKKAADAA